MTMTRRTPPALTAMVAVALVLAACGGDDAAAPASESTLPAVDTTAASSGDYDHPTGADDVVIEYAEVGGFTTREFAFQQTPRLLVSGDGRAFSPGAQIEIYPGPLLPAVQVQSITEAGIQSIFAAADAAGLLADVEYEAPTNIADASTAQLILNVNDETWVHEAYALGFSAPGGAGESTPERQALLDFVTQLNDLPALVGAEQLGEVTLFEPESYQIEAIVIDDLSVYGTDGIEPTVVEWPVDVSVRLADASTRVDVPAAEVADTLGAANQLTFFTDAGVTYQVLARPRLPGWPSE